MPVSLKEGKMEPVSYKRYPVNSEDYLLHEIIGEGCSANVRRALCIPFNEIVAIKVFDLERCKNDLDVIRREVHIMSSIENPKILRAHCSFTFEKSLWVVMPNMAAGSCLHILKSSFPDGFEEPVIATLLLETLTALAYLHGNGHIHRDVKAGNILLDSNGAVKLADFGVPACMFEKGARKPRNSFVGTPCWMAPEVIRQDDYDFRADIWSFGITAIELALGHAPFSKYPSRKVILMTLQHGSPGLDPERVKKFSKPFKRMVDACLEKDPKKRPTAEILFKRSFFKRAKDPEYLACKIVEVLPPLGEGFRKLMERDAGTLVQSEQLSRQVCNEEISAWNFNTNAFRDRVAVNQDSDTNSSHENAPTGASTSAPCYEDGADDTGSSHRSFTSAIQPQQ